MDYIKEAPEILREFLVYHETIKGHSKKTTDEYFLDLRTMFRFLKQQKGLVPRGTEFEDIPIDDVDLEFVRNITLSDIYGYLAYLARDREKNSRSVRPGHGLTATSRARKVATIRSYFKYLTVKTKQLEKNPVADLDSPKTAKTLPRYLSLDESTQLLSAVDGSHKERDYCIITLFLNCGLRISELAGLDLTDIHADSLRVFGKGGKERIVYLNDACAEAINDYLKLRRDIKALDSRALFLSSRKTRITKSTIHHLVKTHLASAGLDASKYSSHKLRHTAATLLLRNGVDVRTLQELLGHEHLNTTQIYTHVENDSLREAAALSPLSKIKKKEK
ncbi:Site-specific recombinase XerD [Sporobacter termitidis DSM 10068]|uniref:Site-specific recombinase XerD n=1 Tax=Sporobacter termitidis DSM 10068 TaxID=1123282 RepID=A0A1M5TGP5_9FIRM|nr:tyrosine recombinase XerC [Sporobacter termitidis]SHH49922.1 Site-specific recombinase XerD [Sporobacter termitidis DSM 10068]